MRARFFRRVSSHSVSYSLLKEAYKAQKPGLISGALSGRSWRYQSMGKTIEQITNPEEQKKLQQHATDNLKRWAKTKSRAPLKVEVVPKDWGTATLEATKEHGELYSVLNMANSLYPGGAVFEGGNAQEENMWHRTTCALSLMNKWIKFDNNTYSFLYTEEGRKLVEARKKMTDAEIGILKERCPEVFSSDELYKVLFSKEPRVCFRGEELYFDPSSENEYISRG
ncbi:TPA: poly(ADP-ribose) glycohydrolase domain-containing protein, partial [Legionella anisa]